jgi:hypothetical protein
MRLEGFGEVVRRHRPPAVDAWWAPVAERHAPYHPADDYPAMAVAACVADWLDPARAEGESTLYDVLPGVHYLEAAHAELISAVMVVGYLAANPEAAAWPDVVLADRSFRWAFGPRSQWPWYADEAALRAHDVRCLGVQGWAPWWRAASIWPGAQSVDEFAIACEYIWQHRHDLAVVDHRGTWRATRDLFDARGWALRSPGELQLPPLRLADILRAVVGPRREQWPWPYDSWPVGDAGAPAPAPLSVPR